MVRVFCLSLISVNQRLNRLRFSLWPAEGPGVPWVAYCLIRVSSRLTCLPWRIRGPKLLPLLLLLLLTTSLISANQCDQCHLSRRAVDLW